MSRTKLASKAPTTKVPTLVVPAVLDDLLQAVEDRCNHAAGIVSATARVIAGDELGLHHDDVPRVYAAARLMSATKPTRTSRKPGTTPADAGTALPDARRRTASPRRGPRAPGQIQ